MTQDLPQSEQAQEGDENERLKSRDPLVGTVLDGRFQIEDVLGSGGMSVVYKATQLRVNRHVAIKTLRLQLDTKDIYRERFQREISSLCALNHPNIVTVYDALIGPDDQPYVVMDYLRGRSLEALIEDEGPMNVERFARISIQICSALEHAHKKGIIHRDLKPGNVVLMDNEMDFVKVVDFGLAKIGDQNRRLTHSGELWGSPPYMSPEQCMGEAQDTRSDLYSIGAVMYEMLTGYDPYRNATSVFEFIKCHTTVPPPAMTSTNPLVRVPQKVESMVFKALEKDPNKRYQTAKEMQDAIVEACSGNLNREQGEFLFHLANQASTPSAKPQTGQQSVADERMMTPSQAFNMALNPFSAEMMIEPQVEGPAALDGAGQYGQLAGNDDPTASSADRWRSPGNPATPASQIVQPPGEIVKPVGEVVPSPGVAVPPAQIPNASSPSQSYAALDAIPTPSSLQSASSPAVRSSFATGASAAAGGPQSPAGGLGGRLASSASPSGGAPAAPPARLSRPGVSEGGPSNSNTVIVVFFIVLVVVAGLIFVVPSLTGRGGNPVKTSAPSATPGGEAPANAGSSESGAGTEEQTPSGTAESSDDSKAQAANQTDDQAPARNHPRHPRMGQRGLGGGRPAHPAANPPAGASAPVRAATVKPRPAAVHTEKAASHAPTPPAQGGSKPDPWSKLENLRMLKK